MHKVSPANIFDKKFKRLTLNFSAKIDANITLCKIFGHENFETASRKRWRLFSPCNLSLNFFCTKWYTLYFYNKQQGKLFFLCTANWCVSNLNFLLKMLNIACHVVTRNTFFSHIFFCVATQYNLTRTDQYLLRKNWCVGAKIILNRFLLFWSQRLRRSENFSSQIFFFTYQFRFQNFLHFFFINRWLKEVFLIYK